MAEARYDFQKFDFNAKRFANSENCERMTAEEVGQYLLLLVRAWNGGRDASLPDDTVLLARWARSSSVSDAVMAMFPVVETSYGPRRRNETLYAEWLAAVARTEAGRDSVAKRKDRQSSEVLTLQVPTRDLQGTNLPETEPGPVSVSEAGSGAATGPGTEPRKQIGSGSSHVLLAPSNGAAAPSPAQAAPAPDYLSFRRTWHGLVKASGRLSKGRHFVDKYMSLCNSFGADKVLAGFTQWAQAKPDWAWAHDHGHAFNAFAKQLPEVLEELDDDEVLPTATTSTTEASFDVIPDATPAQLAGAEQSIADFIAQEQREREERIKKFGAHKEDGAGTPESYLEALNRGN